MNQSVYTASSVQQHNVTFQNFLLYHSHKKQHSLEIWAVNLRFHLIYENLLKSIATARSECKTENENKPSYNTNYIVLDLIDFFDDD